MEANKYLQWLGNTASFWWNDSAVIKEVEAAIEDGATGVTTNPLLVARTLYANPIEWKPYLDNLDAFKADARVEEIIRRVTMRIAALLEPIYQVSQGAQGYVCAQVDPSLAGDRDAMMAMAQRLSKWADNIAVKLPGTSAGVDVIEECVAQGIPTVGTVSFTVPQAVEIAMHQQRGIDRCRQAGGKAPAAFSVLMVGRLDDYLRDIAKDQCITVPEKDIIQAGTAAIKRAYKITKERGYVSKLMPAGMRVISHATALAGADMSMSLSRGIQKGLMDIEAPYCEGVDEEVDANTIARLHKIPEFVRAYEPDGMKIEEFITYGATQRTLSQFVEAGWLRIKEYNKNA